MGAPGSALLPIEAAIYALVAADSTFNALCPGGIASHEDATQVYPFTLIDGSMEKPWNTLGGAAVGHGRDDLIRLHVYSRYKGDKEALQIVGRLATLLDFAVMVVAGYQTVMIEYVSGKVLIEDKDKLETRHAPVDFRVRVH